MPHVTRSILISSVVGLAIALALAPAVAQAQDAGMPDRMNVISANPFGLLLDLFNAEYERVITPSSTAGVGGSFYPGDENISGDYLNLDAFWRFYLNGTPFEGWAIGAKAGYTTELGAGVGFDVNHSWLAGPSDNVYIGIGFGLKRVIGTDEGHLEFVPTFRIINVGIAF